MSRLDILKKTKIVKSPRIQMLSGIFDCPIDDISKFELHTDLPIDDDEWNIGLIVGPSGCGKSIILNTLGTVTENTWDKQSVITSFSDQYPITKITETLGAVGLNNIKTWMRPFHTLSNGEQFRAQIARSLLEDEGVIYIDEFTSVVDRQVAQVACHAIQKFVRRENLRIVVASCHYDIIDWLQPDWQFQPHVDMFTRRLLRRRPEINITINKTKHSTWRMFAKYHYMIDSLHRGAMCYVLSCNGSPAVFAGLLHRPRVQKRGLPIWGVSRVVTLPDYQGLGLACVLLDFLGEKFAKEKKRLRMYPAHPNFVKSFHRSEHWRCVKTYGKRKTISVSKSKVMGDTSNVGGRRNAVFEYTPTLKDKKG